MNQEYLYSHRLLQKAYKLFAGTFQGIRSILGSYYFQVYSISKSIFSQSIV